MSDRSRVFFRYVLPALVIVNVILGLINLMLLRAMPGNPMSWVPLLGGAFSLALAGWLAGTLWSRYYWRGVMDRQVRTWRGVVDAVFGWIEETPVSQDSLSRLKRSIDQTLPD